MSENEKTGFTLVAPEAWPELPALLPSGEVDVEAVRGWIARHVFGEATSAGNQSADWFESYKAAAPKGWKLLQRDIEQDAATLLGKAVVH